MSSALDLINDQLATSLRDFNRWMSQNSTVNVEESSHFKEQRQAIKLLKLRKAELEELINLAESQPPTVLVVQNNPNIAPFTKQRIIQPSEGITGNKLGGRRYNKTSLV